MFRFRWLLPLTPDEHPVRHTLLDRTLPALSHLNRKNVVVLFVIVYKYRNKINYSMLASYYSGRSVAGLSLPPPCQILCHRTHSYTLDDVCSLRRFPSSVCANYTYLLALSSSSHLLFIAFFLAIFLTSFATVYHLC